MASIARVGLPGTAQNQKTTNMRIDISKYIYGAVAVFSLLTALVCSSHAVITFAALITFMYSADKAGVVNYIDEIRNED